MKNSTIVPQSSEGEENAVQTAHEHEETHQQKDGYGGPLFSGRFWRQADAVKHRPKPADLTIAHLAFIHLLMLIIRALLDMDIFGVQDTWNDITCKTVVYLNRLMRSLSVSTTCMLNILQAITLSPQTSILAKLKVNISTTESVLLSHSLGVHHVH
ncbi:Vomeronasal type-1 receptor A8 [Sciurus carolinensis]|uniref:Vomeronasal type-1 receptor n=1 Tax=Sciurus carolinensis TaxID=30640 RepID=A0AA41N431_SCICA|nr:Vomeronasal type-1 receptor A8 [Sciurus carolinensis]